MTLKEVLIKLLDHPNTSKLLDQRVCVGNPSEVRFRRVDSISIEINPGVGIIINTGDFLRPHEIK